MDPRTHTNRPKAFCSFSNRPICTTQKIKCGSDTNYTTDEDGEDDESGDIAWDERSWESLPALQEKIKRLILVPTLRDYDEEGTAEDRRI